MGWFIGEAIRFGIYVVGAGGLGAFLVKRYGQGVIDHQFAKNLAAFQTGEQQKLDVIRAGHAEALEFVKAGNNVSLSRAVKLHDKEFDVLPEAWRLMVIAYSDANQATAMFTEHPDLARLSPLRKAALFEAFKLQEWEREEVERASDSTRELGRLLRMRALWKAKESHAEVHNFLLERGVFIGEPLIQRMDEVVKYVGDALFDWEHMYDDWKTTERGLHSRNVSGTVEVINEIKLGVRAHLRGEPIPDALQVPRTFPRSLLDQ